MNSQVVIPIRRWWRKLDHDARIDGDDTVLVNDQRVDVHFLDPRQFAGDAGHAQQYVDQLIQVYCGHVAELSEHPRNPRAIDQVSGQAMIQGREGNGRIAHDLDRRAATAKTDHRAEDRVANDPDHEFAAVGAAVHLFDSDTRNRGARRLALYFINQLPVNAANLVGRVDIESHATCVGFVRDIRRQDLHRYRKADRSCYHECLVS